MDLASFIAGLDDFEDCIVPAVADLEARTMERVMTDVVEGTPDLAPPGTPYRTGYAKANWIPSIGEPSTDVLPIFEDMHEFLTGARVGAAARGSTFHPLKGTQAHQEHGLSQAEAEAYSLQRIPGVAADIRASKTYAPPVFITNNVDYIQDLEHGSSIQAPGGFALLAVSAIKALGLGKP